MEKNSVTIISRDSPNPDNQKNYTLICASHSSHSVRITVTSKPAVVRKWVSSIRYRHRFQLRRGRLVVSLGVQWVPNSTTGAATLQLCVGHNCLIFQLLYAGQSPALLRRFLTDSDVILVGVWNSRDTDMLRRSRHHLRVTRIKDLRDPASGVCGCSKGASMETLASKILNMQGMVKEEWVGRSNWGVPSLSKEQVKYAALDAFLAFLIGKKIKVWKYC